MSSIFHLFRSIVAYKIRHFTIWTYVPEVVLFPPSYLRLTLRSIQTSTSSYGCLSISETERFCYKLVMFFHGHYSFVITWFHKHSNVTKRIWEQSFFYVLRGQATSWWSCLQGVEANISAITRPGFLCKRHDVHCYLQSFHLWPFNELSNRFYLKDAVSCRQSCQTQMELPYSTQVVNNTRCNII